jgi:hypothetical protein
VHLATKIRATLDLQSRGGSMLLPFPISLGGTPEGRAHANEDFWPKALAFLDAAVSAKSHFQK